MRDLAARAGVWLAVWLMVMLPATAADDRIQAALDNLGTLVRPGEVGYATISDGNKFVQCRRTADGAMRCEASGSLMQPSLAAVLTPERLHTLAAEGWTLDPAFGHYVQTFPRDLTTPEIASKIRSALLKGYDANPSRIGVKTQWVEDVPCPPRITRSQSLAGSVSNTPSMASVTREMCAYEPSKNRLMARAVSTPDDMVRIYGPRVIGELQRLRINAGSNVWFSVSAGIGYVQCAPEQQPDGLYCEAQSPASWPSLATIITPDREAWLVAAGFSDPGSAPNYWKVYPKGRDDAEVARELLTLLFEVYGYRGDDALKFKTQ